MALLQAKCTSCGANLQVDGSKDAAICPYCGTAFVVERAIANFYGSNVGSINASVVNIYGQDPKAAASVKSDPKPAPEEKPVIPSKEFLRKVSLANRFLGAIQRGLILRSDGMLDVSYGGVSNPPGSMFTYNHNVFRWRNIKEFRVLVFTQTDFEDPFVVALTFDGKCYADSLYYHPGQQIIPQEFLDQAAVIRGWTRIVQLIASKNGMIGLKDDGSVVSSWGDAELQAWKNVKKICDVSHGYDLSCLGLTNDGRVLAHGVKNWEKKAVEHWKDIIDVSPGGDSFLGHTKYGTVIEPTIDDTVHISAKNVITLKCPNLNYDGSFSYRSWQGTYNKAHWDAVEKLGKGYISGGGQFYLSEDGRVDQIVNYTTISREVDSDVIALVLIPFGHGSAMGFLKADGLIRCSSLKEPIRLLTGDPAKYGREISQPVPRSIDREKIASSYRDVIDQCRKIMKARQIYETIADRKKKKERYGRIVAFYEDRLRELGK